MRHMKNVIKRAFGLTAAVCILLLAFSGCTKTPDVGQNSSTGSIDESSTNGESSVDSSTPASDSSEPTSDNESSVTNGNSDFSVVVDSHPDFNYQIVDNEICILSYKGDAEHVVIPSEIDGLPVVSIYNTFKNNTKLVSVKIPDTITKIDAYSFESCYSLSSISFPPNLEHLGYAAFAGCKSLTSITIPKGIETWGQSVFASCTSLTEVIFEEGVTSIGSSGTFSSCTSLTSFEVPDGVKEIPESYFEQCTSLKSVTLPDSITDIGKGAFSFSGLTSIVIPPNVRYLDNPFFYCKSLNSIKFEGNAPAVERSTFSVIKSPDLVIYYHEDKEGWTSPTFRNVPTEIW